GSLASYLLTVDGEEVVARRAYAGFPPRVLRVVRKLAAGKHRVVVKVGRGADRVSLVVALARRDGAPSDTHWATVAAGDAPPPPPAPAKVKPPVLAAEAAGLAAALEPECGAVFARLVAARDAFEFDREGAKSLVEEAL